MKTEKDKYEPIYKRRHSAFDTEWNDNIRKLFGKRYMLTVEEEQTILNITKKFL